MAQTSDQTGSSDSQPSSSSSFTPPDGCDPEVAGYLRTASERGIQDEIHRGQYPFSQPQSVSSLACLDTLLTTTFTLLNVFQSLAKRTSVVKGTCMSVRLDYGGRRS